MAAEDAPTLKRHPSQASHPERRQEAMLSREVSVSDRPRRQKSLVRPERARNDPNNRLHHYRQRATQQQAEGEATADMTVTTTTATTANHSAQPRPLERRPTARQAILRRGKSILGRDEKRTNEDGGVEYDGKSSTAAEEADADAGRRWSGMPSLWLTYCRLLTCCVPSVVLARLIGAPKGPAHMAWREKIGLVSCILAIMGFVGFLTFGFTQAVCPVPPLSLPGGGVSHGYLIIQGWAFMLADWNNHPAVPGLMNASANVLYPPVDAGGMDASFLFQEPQPSCVDVIQPKTGNPPVYFPCRLFNPNLTAVPDPKTFTNTTGCHLSQPARQAYQSIVQQGVPRSKGGFDKAGRVYYDWANISNSDHFMVYNGDVLNLLLLQSLPTDVFNVPQGGLIQQIMTDRTPFVGKDMSRAIASYRQPNTNWEKEAECLAAIIKVGSIDTLNLGCMASDIVLYLSLAVILGVILTKFVLAVIFGWFLSWKLGNFKEGGSYAARMQREAEIENWTRDIHTTGPVKRPKSGILSTNNLAKRRSMFPQTSRFTQPSPGSTRFDAEKLPAPAWKTPSSTLEGLPSRQSFYFKTPSLIPSPSPSPSMRFFPDASPRRSSFSSSDLHSGDSNGGPICPFPLSQYAVRQPQSNYKPHNFTLAHTICLVTCYSESLEGVRTTLDSIATSDYPNSHKLILVICDGLITGHGNDMSTPDACVAMMDHFIVPPEQVEPKHYVAIADGSKGNNMAKVYAGFYKYDDSTIEPSLQQRVPMVTIVKCGTPEEADEKKPGNRGKRDSQIILMQFMQKVMFNERMTTMEYEFFNNIWRVTGVTPDSYEICLMVDADTKLYPDALTRMVGCAVMDPEISGLCGETKIANKTDSWVTMIQVFEYYISHHQSKAFESVFGGVTCLPGCFCMYRIKAPKGPDGYWVPILANPDIVEHYSENVVDTLHKKNLLLLGEDRYLSTLMLRTFPNRKMMFVPQAVCKTIVPDTFSVLLSQRRRWINSTIHNLMELLFVHDLCGTFCFSMQFVVFMELVGTLALPAAISFTLYLVIMAIIGQPAVIPLILLALILGLPAVLIVMTSRKVVYVGWMLVYLFSLPIWNFVLPTYAYWHFDDFSWGDTRRVEGSGKESGHGDKEGEFDSSKITMKKWGDYEKDRRRRLAIERNQPIPRFLETMPSAHNFDIFNDPAYGYRIDHAGSAGSNDSDVPLTQKNAAPSVSNPPRFHGEPSLDNKLLEIPMTTLHDAPSAGMDTADEYRQKEEYSTPAFESELTQGLGRVQPERSYDRIMNSWAEPAPYHHVIDSSLSPLSRDNTTAADMRSDHPLPPLPPPPSPPNHHQEW